MLLGAEAPSYSPRQSGDHKMEWLLLGAIGVFLLFRWYYLWVVDRRR